MANISIKFLFLARNWSFICTQIECSYFLTNQILSTQLVWLYTALNLTLTPDSWLLISDFSETHIRFHIFTFLLGSMTLELFPSFFHYLVPVPYIKTNLATKLKFMLLHVGNFYVKWKSLQIRKETKEIIGSHYMIDYSLHIK